MYLDTLNLQFTGEQMVPGPFHWVDCVETGAWWKTFSIAIRSSKMTEKQAWASKRRPDMVAGHLVQDREETHNRWGPSWRPTGCRLQKPRHPKGEPFFSLTVGASHIWDRVKTISWWNVQSEWESVSDRMFFPGMTRYQSLDKVGTASSQTHINFHRLSNRVPMVSEYETTVELLGKLSATVEWMSKATGPPQLNGGPTKFQWATCRRPRHQKSHVHGCLHVWLERPCGHRGSVSEGHVNRGRLVSPLHQYFGDEGNLGVGAFQSKLGSLFPVVRQLDCRLIRRPGRGTQSDACADLSGIYMYSSSTVPRSGRGWFTLPIGYKADWAWLWFYYNKARSRNEVSSRS
jgi:hypothetical protein